MSLIHKKIYLDYSATTSVHPAVTRVIKRYLRHRFANPSSIHESGLMSKGSIELARERVAKVLNCQSDQIYFTGSGTESNNMAIQGFMNQSKRGQHIISSLIEHSSILSTVEALSKSDVEVSYVSVDAHGRYDLEHLKRLIKPNTTMIALSYVNSEIGTIQDVEAIAKIANEKSIHLHLDAVQALPYLKINLEQMKADSVSFSGHKIRAPKGIGLLYMQEPNGFKPIVFGGSQEGGIRPGTENIPYIMGIAKAISINENEKEQKSKKVHQMQQYLIKNVLEKIPEVQLTGHPTARSPHHVSFCFKGIDGKQLVDQLSDHGFETSSGTACSSKRKGPSKVIEACGIDEAYQMGSLRVTISPNNTVKQLRNFIDVLSKVVMQLRAHATILVDSQSMISQEALKQLILQGDQIQVINASPFAVKMDALPGIIHAPIWKINTLSKKMNDNMTTVVICQHGDVLAPKTAKRLTSLGFRDVRVLKGGFSSMQSATDML